MKIGNFNTSDKVFVIAELSANHGHNIEVAIETIRAAKRAGADAIKLQTYTADSMTIQCNKESFTKVLNGTIWEGRTLYNLYEEAYTPWEWHKKLFEVAKEEGLICFSTPFDNESVDFLEQFNPPAYKIASFEIKDIPLIEYAAGKGRPMILSTGVAEIEDIALAVKACRSVGNEDIALLKCTSAYPAPMEEANLITIENLKQTFNVEAGLSDHTLGHIAPVVATTIGARIIEKHFIKDKSIGGPDASFSLDENEFAEMVSAVRDAEKCIGKVTYKLSEKSQLNKKFERSLFIVKDVKAGEILTNESVRAIRPAGGLHPKHLSSIVGKKVLKDIERGTPCSWDCIKHENA